MGGLRRGSKKKSRQGRWTGTNLSRMGCYSMAQIGYDLPGLGEDIRGKGGELVAVLGMAREREDVGAEPHEPDAILFVPTNHWHDIPGVG